MTSAPASPVERARRHLATLAREPRPAGGAAEARGRDYAAGVLRSAGFEVRYESFEYSAFPGRYATPVAGGLAALSIVTAAIAALLLHRPVTSLAILVGGAALLTAFVRAMLGDAVLDLPLDRARSENLIATRAAPGSVPSVWLVAHLDSKSQPVPSLARAAGIALLGGALLFAMAAGVLGARGVPAATTFWAVGLAAMLVGAPGVLGAVVGARSDGAVDNASGVASVLEAALRVRPEVECGVLLPSAEELGLAGARAFCREWARHGTPGTALNCDGVDDAGPITVLHTGIGAESVTAALLAECSGARIRKAPPGLLTDAIAFSDRGWRAVTVSRGTLRTLRRVHRPTDALSALEGRGLDPVATLLARAVEALAP